ncbi:radical SAM family heme chaperone HemW [Wenxinia saemankumensis]|uniref:Heme chaperone HemW n=1 Tax=Wenxinia saemankumensis TaxID=1447782 RepID=A0A1M6G1Q1_9RHOB|nr:radical SAM family heme chaperone HemW [Wenxinia saemankumensis]SHJ03850.1 oxygen-independent coproporphyrinogen-3 oxidase [Wenxinia saemankumensis]
MAEATGGLAGDGGRDGGFALYLHWPFCQAKCPYCDFNSHVVAAVDQDRWAAAFETEIARVRDETGPRRLSSIYFGGGTPSLMEPRTVERILSAARVAWSFANDIEITLEANPTSIEAGRFRGYREAGVDRVSIGVQALDDRDLRALGRRHDAAEALAAIETGRAIFDRVSFDLIYARQDQSLAAWEAELARALALGPDHLSLYQLTIEPGTAFGARFAAGGLHGLPGEDLAADLWDTTQEMTDAAGLPAYEVSNHARPGQESRHNRVYWTGGDYAGIGPGAHGRLTLDGIRHATESHMAPGAWIGAVERAGSGYSAQVALDGEEIFGEALLMGLRIREGIAETRLGGADPGFAGRVAELEGLGMVTRQGGRLRATDAGRPLLNEILRRLLP